MGKNQKKTTKDKAPVQEEATSSKANTNNFFDFDMETNIFDKLTENKTNYFNKKNNTSWSYDNIIKNETHIQQTKENKKKAQLNIEDTKPQTMNVKEPKTVSNQITQNINNDNDEETFLNDKFENSVYAKGISFTNFNLSKLIVKGLSEMEFYTPTKVQEKVIPIVLKGHDVLVNSETGSGKTACYLLPIIQRIITTRGTRDSSQALILVPTRELALQCNEMLSKLSKYVEISFLFLCGGMSVESQMSQIKTTLPEIIIATPGRLIDMLYNYNTISLENINILVLDEADKLLELGFKDAIMEILEIIKKNNNRQTLLFSATLNTKITDLGNHALNNPIKIKIAQSAILTNLTQSILRMKFSSIEQNEFEKRMSYLINVIKIQKLTRTIIFFNTKSECHQAFLTLRKFDIDSVAELHSNITQTDRLRALDGFQKGEVAFLLATDIAGRGIDIEKVRCVINFQMPLIADRYIHRIGRTARKGYLGKAITICDEKDRLVLKKLLKKEKIEIKLNFIKIPNDDIKNTYKELIKMQEELKEKMEDEKVNRELMVAERDIDKTMNYKLYEDEIKNRPKKRWFESKKDKMKRLKEMRKEFNKKKEDLYS